MAYEDPLLMELKIASAIIGRILEEISNLANIITWECLQKLKYLGRSLAFSRSVNLRVWSLDS